MPWILQKALLYSTHINHFITMHYIKYCCVFNDLTWPMHNATLLFIRTCHKLWQIYILVTKNSYIPKLLNSSLTFPFQTLVIHPHLHNGPTVRVGTIILPQKGFYSYTLFLACLPTSLPALIHMPLPFTSSNRSIWLCFSFWGTNCGRFTVRYPHGTSLASDVSSLYRGVKCCFCRIGVGRSDQSNWTQQVAELLSVTTRNTNGVCLMR